MNNGDTCWHCGGKLCWDADYDYKDVYDVCDDTINGIVTYLHCTNCGAHVEYTIPFEGETNNDAK